MNNNDRLNVLGVGVNQLNLKKAVALTMCECRERKMANYICVTGVHGVMECQNDQKLKNIHNRSFLTVPDGMPLVWFGRLTGHKDIGRVYGPDFMRMICRKSASRNRKKDTKPLTHFLFGADTQTLDKLTYSLEKKYPHIRITGRYSPPFWTDLDKPPLTIEQETELRRILDKDPPDFFWVGLSTPKQEKFMCLYSCNSQDADDIIAPLPCGMMLGVGAAFDVLSGNRKDAPKWVQNIGFQWFYRLTHETGRLWKRYLKIVPCFIFLIIMQITGLRKFQFEE